MDFFEDLRHEKPEEAIKKIRFKDFVREHFDALTEFRVDGFSWKQIARSALRKAPFYSKNLTNSLPVAYFAEKKVRLKNGNS